MRFFIAHFSRKHLVLAVLIVAVVLLVEVVTRINLVQASPLACDDGRCGRATLPFPTARPAGLIPRLCGKLVFVTDRISGLQSMALLPCTGGGKPYIFKRHPRDVIPFYQFRDAVIADGAEVCTVEYGCINRYITTFKNYIGLDSCAACGSNVPPTWTRPPLTPYTATPVPPTSTPYIPTFTPTLSPTLSPDKYTPTVNLFELLRGTVSPSPSPSATPSPTRSEIPATATSAAPATGWGLSSPLCPGSGFFLLGLAALFAGWHFVIRRGR